MNYHEVKLLSRKLRRNQTASEKLLWARIRDRQLNGFKFLRQHPILYDRKGNDLSIFIPDFYCPAARLVIEVDGGIHVNLRERDQWREETLIKTGFTILRIQNNELADIESVLNKIRMILQSRSV